MKGPRWALRYLSILVTAAGFFPRTTLLPVLLRLLPERLPPFRPSAFLWAAEALQFRPTGRPLFLSPIAMTQSTTSDSSSFSALSTSNTRRDDTGRSNYDREMTANNNSLTLVALPREWQDYDLKKDEVHGISDLQQFFSVLELSEHASPSTTNGGSESKSCPFDTIISTDGLEPNDVIVALELECRRDIDFLKEPPIPGTYTGNQDRYSHKESTIKIRLNRDAQESSRRAFQRLELSVAKKLASERKSKRKRKKPKEITTQKEPSSKLLVRREQGSDSDYSSEEKIHTEHFDAIGLCRELASVSGTPASSARLEISIPKDESISDEISIGDVVSPSTTHFRFGVRSNPPVILATQTFESFRSKLFVGIPIVIQTTLLHATSAEISWFLSSDNTENEELVLRNSHVFVPEANHVGKSLSVVLLPTRGEGHIQHCGRPEAYQFLNAIEALPKMPIVSPLRKLFVEEKKPPKDGRLRVCTYNILADLYVSRKGTIDGETTYPHVLYQHVEKTRRMPMIVAELQAYQADIICLQEVDRSVFDAYFQSVFKASGYDGYYSNKASPQREGCAMFWSTNIFESIETLSFDVKELFAPSSDGIVEKEWESMEAIRKLLESHPKLNKVTTEKLGQVLQIARLKPKRLCQGQPNAVVIANTHLFWHPMADHVRALQAFAVAKKIDEIRRHSGSISSDPFILCGDLNSDPLSGACRLLTRRVIEPNHHDCWKYLHEYQWDVDDNHVETMVDSGTTAEERRSANRYANPKAGETAISPPSIAFPDPFPDLFSGCQPNPSFTNFSPQFVETLDYVFACRPSEKQEFGFFLTESAPMPITQDVKEFVSMVR